MIKVLIKKNLFFIVLISVFILSFWGAVYHKLTEPADIEQLEVFFTATSCDKNELTNIFNRVSSFKNIHYTVISEEDEYYESIFQINGIIYGDILIVEKSLFDNPNAWKEFLDLSSINIDSDLLLTSDENISYGILVKSMSCDLLNGLITYKNDKNDYVLVVRKNSMKANISKEIVQELIKQCQAKNA